MPIHTTVGILLLFVECVAPFSVRPKASLTRKRSCIGKNTEKLWWGHCRSSDRDFACSLSVNTGLSDGASTPPSDKKHPKGVKKKSTKSSPRSTSIRSSKNFPLYWSDDSDEFDCQIHGGALANKSLTPCRSIRFTVRGKPVPLRRHRTSRGFMYNPSANAQLVFREVVQDLLRESGTLTTEPLFDEETFIAVSIVFRLKRPRKHFVGSKAGPGRLRPTAPRHLSPSRIDVDNLAKFVLDSLNKLLYADDRQVVSLHATKVLDTVGECEGATEICIRRLDEADIDAFLKGSVDTQ